MGGTYWYYVSIRAIVAGIANVLSTKLMAIRNATIPHSLRQQLALYYLGKV